ncbi:MAG: esterase [Cyanobium sp.]
MGQPLLVLGGFLISPEAYQPMAEVLRQLANQPVSVVPVTKLDWLLTVFPFGWARILDRVAEAVQSLAAVSPTGKVTLIGHSSGGIMLRLFLADGPFERRHYRGRSRADTLVMLGSPHTAIKATPLRQRVARQLPGAWFSRATESHPVRYLSVAGDLALDDPGATATARRLAPSAYRNSTGRSDDRGDGLVPVSSALLEGSQTLVLPGVAHGGAFGCRWYGSPDVVRQWWQPLMEPPSL